MKLIKLFKNFNKKEIMLFLVCVCLVAFGVWLDLKVPDYMSEITRLVQTEGSEMSDILVQGFYMILCSIGSLVTAIIVGYIASFLSASFSKTIRHKIFDKVENMSVAKVKKFSIRSLITRTTNDVTQIEMLISMGLQ